MKKKDNEVTLRASCRFSLEDDDSGGPTGPDYLLLQLTPKKTALKKNKFLRDLDVSIYLKEQIDPKAAEMIKELLTNNCLWLQYRYFK